MSNIKNLIFDLGGVIIDLDFDSAYKAFAAISEFSVAQIEERTRGLMLFTEYEMGLVSSEHFRQGLKDLLNISADNQAIDNAWCALLGEIPTPRLELLKQLKNNYRVFALSNTNDIHVQKFNSIVAESIGSASLLDEFFEKVYFSHEMKMRKPNPEIYEYVLEEQALNADQTLFLDDNLDNISGAASVGIQTMHVADPELVIRHFNGTT